MAVIINSYRFGGGLVAPNLYSVSAASSTAIWLYWTDPNTTEDGYYIERSLNGSSWSLISTTSANATSAYDSGLSADTTYYYRVRAFKGGTTSSYSSVLSATTTGNPPYISEFRANPPAGTSVYAPAGNAYAESYVSWYPQGYPSSTDIYVDGSYWTTRYNPSGYSYTTLQNWTEGTYHTVQLINNYPSGSSSTSATSKTTPSNAVGCRAFAITSTYARYKWVTTSSLPVQFIVYINKADWSWSDTVVKYDSGYKDSTLLHEFYGLTPDTAYEIYVLVYDYYTGQTSGAWEGLNSVAYGPHTFYTLP